MAYLLVILSSIFFYVSLQWVSDFRGSYTYLIFGLPALAVLLVAERRISRFRLSSREEVKGVSDPDRPAVSFYAGILLIFQTLLVHVVGGSVGREGVGIQLGGWAARWAKAPSWYRAGCIATGISVIFGAPVTAAVFIFETSLVQKKKIDWKEIVAVPIMAIGADLIVHAIGIRHFQFPQFSFLSLQQLLNLKGLVVLAVFSVLVTAFSASFLLISSSVTSRVQIMSDRSLAFSASVFLAVFMLVAFHFGDAAGLTGLGIQIWPWLYSGEGPPIEIGPTLLLLAILKVTFTAGFSGLGFKGGEVTPMLAVSSLIGVFLSTAPMGSIPVISAIGFSCIWGVSARRPLVAAALGYEYFGGAAVFAGLITYISLKLGDAIFNSGFLRSEKVRSAWHNGLYD